MTYQITSFTKHAELDDYSKGCDMSSACMGTVNVRFEDELSVEILRKVMEFFGVERDAVTLGDDDAPGRVDISRFENSNGEPPTDDQMLLWKLGKWALWQVTYTGQLEHFGPGDWTTKCKRVLKTEGGR